MQTWHLLGFPESRLTNSELTHVNCKLIFSSVAHNIATANGVMSKL